MSSSLTPFAFDDALVRVHQDGQGLPWFVAKDVCRVLELGNVTEATRGLEEDERCSVVLNTPGGRQEMLIITESGLYSLIFRSRKPQARAFRKWVTSEVLPAIRLTGSYGAQTSLPGCSSGTALALPGEALRLRPAVRAQVLTCAVAAAKMGNEGPEAVEAHFLRFCALVGCTSAQQTDSVEDLLERWAAECLEDDPNRRTQAKHLHQSLLSWCRKRGERDVPSWRRVSEWIGVRYLKQDSRVVHYLGVWLKKTAD